MRSHGRFGDGHSFGLRWNFYRRLLGHGGTFGSAGAGLWICRLFRGYCYLGTLRWIVRGLVRFAGTGRSARAFPFFIRWHDSWRCHGHFQCWSSAGWERWIEHWFCGRLRESRDSLSRRGLRARDGRCVGKRGDGNGAIRSSGTATPIWNGRDFGDSGGGCVRLYGRFGTWFRTSVGRLNVVTPCVLKALAALALKTLTASLAIHGFFGFDCFLRAAAAIILNHLFGKIALAIRSNITQSASYPLGTKGLIPVCIHARCGNLE